MFAFLQPCDLKARSSSFRLVSQCRGGGEGGLLLLLLFLFVGFFLFAVEVEGVFFLCFYLGGVCLFV